MTQIDAYAKELASWQWLNGQKLPFSMECSERFSWGNIQLPLHAESGCVTSVQVYSDAMEWQLADEITNALTGCKFNLQSITESLKSTITDYEVCQDLCSLLTQLSI